MQSTEREEKQRAREREREPEIAREIFHFQGWTSRNPGDQLLLGIPHVRAGTQAIRSGSQRFLGTLAGDQIGS